MIYLRLGSIEAERERRPKGYCEAVIGSGRIVGEHLELSTESYFALARRFRPKIDLRSRARSFLKSFASWLRNGFRTVPRDIFKERQAHCSKCPEWQQGPINICRLCGCSTDIKLRLPGECCPLGKW